ncbi:dihydropteroate synthase [Candidatus Palibaumannia cicadellinicola]|uniref:Dihydropteroate synthase n=1 Tax=Baumannia cicadellinicola subsp. Homalodisca coagulata TaxID=374463 RepID=Q1LSK4_BAUCH|nr:dihydropteroate synthase [Candidatus Baumannia cicadellinicola]ABF13924.1 dihydropteroate synthase [Baumannia cicadellinicola str. Hc (Homalodisca coagulata)]MBS0032505.1 dihydropteroate synthase [Candidatus Baumannia cicadellinicola]MCJ7461974.1 dihydropteroate synthase [Candidatus Baumannia cicadellinicola]MCJ7462545.1 dihydropteroate synthase [Candidatus Baumannia cicadellinicola]
MDQEKSTKIISNERKLDLSVTQVMGILNVTYDSFSDGGKYHTLSAAIDHAAIMVDAGAKIIDVGGESTRPGANIIDANEEVERVVPVITALVKRFDALISVDTSKALVIRESAAVGVHLINDVRSLSEPGAIEAAAITNLPICIMHMQGEPLTMQQEPFYRDILTEIKAFFSEKINRCEAHGIKKNRLIIDPGFGFGKNVEHNYSLLARLTDLHCFGMPILVGMSRKSMIGHLMNNLPPQLRVLGSVACAVIAAMQGVKIIRVHDVKQTIEALRVVNATLSAKKKFFI